jgi:DNA polymerase III delta prime subunit
MNIFPSVLIISPNQSDIDYQINQICHQLDNQINPNNPDIFTIDKETGWTINLVRQSKHFLSQKPFNHNNKIIIIRQAENLNIESQNALLKTLEEPGDNNYLIISTSKPSKLLPTVISRCQIIKLKNNLQSIKDIPLTITHQIKKDLLSSESLAKDKNQVLPYLENQLKIQQKLLIKNPNTEISGLIQKILKAIQMIEANVDPRSALDFVFLSA